MKILVTGGAGFIGSHVCEELQKNYPQAEVVVLDTLVTGARSNVPQAFKLVELDIRSKELLAFFQAQKFSHVIHLAAQTLVPTSLKDPSLDADLNVMGLINVLEAARKTGVTSVIFSSSAAVYGDNDHLPLLESEKLVPTSFYGLTKAVSEEYLRIYHELYGLNTTVLRFANVYGERQGMAGEGGVISIFAKALAKEEKITVFGDGKQTRDFVYVKDIARALCLGMEHKGYGIFNVSTGQETSLNELISTFQDILQKKPIVEYQKSRTGDIYRSVLSNVAIGQALGLKKFTALKEGLTATCRFFKFS
jgi:UDP-glucose 4-epimerase